MVIKSTLEKISFGGNRKMALFHTKFVGTVSMETAGDLNLVTGWNN